MPVTVFPWSLSEIKSVGLRDRDALLGAVLTNTVLNWTTRVYLHPCTVEESITPVVSLVQKCCQALHLPPGIRYSGLLWGCKRHLDSEIWFPVHSKYTKYTSFYLRGLIPFLFFFLFVWVHRYPQAAMTGTRGRAQLTQQTKLLFFRFKSQSTVGVLWLHRLWCCWFVAPKLSLKMRWKWMEFNRNTHKCTHTHTRHYLCRAKLRLTRLGDHRLNANRDSCCSGPFWDKITGWCDRKGSELTRPHLSWSLFSCRGRRRAEIKRVRGRGWLRRQPREGGREGRGKNRDLKTGSK